MAPPNTLPPEIQLLILQQVAELRNSSNDSSARLSICACVCKRWQLIVEQKTFRHLTLDSTEIQDFARIANHSRRGYIKHILLEIPIEDAHDRWLRVDEMGEGENNLIFTLAVRELWEVLSAWKNHRLTVELGIVSSFEINVDKDCYRNTRRAYSKFLEQGSCDVALPDPHIELLTRFQDPPTDPSYLDVWNWRKRRLLGSTPLEFDFDRLLESEEQDKDPLPKADVIVRLLLRRRYFRNISANALSQIFNAAPRIEVIHFERWCFGRRRYDEDWDMHSALLGHELPPTLKQFSFYEEFSTMYHQQPRKMRPGRRNMRLLKAMIETSRHLEHLSISFAIDAQDFFSHNPQLDWEFLATIALTSTVLVSRSNAMVNELLECVAEGAKKMPKLKTLEIWHYKTGEVGIFRYEKFDRSSKIMWQGTWDFAMSKYVQQAWHQVFTEADGDMYEFGVEVIKLPPEDLTSIGSVFPYLKLKKYILDDVSWTQV
ncbi:hypothetical protein QQX98_005084 [Neonectria punicea]|uniref:DUF6546 domain-containing protein n=1 Tax=Neonectria punicea TaxID=979145 RepID=A0ABR1H6U7_9HYPO